MEEARVYVLLNEMDHSIIFKKNETMHPCYTKNTEFYICTH